ncbi:unnamed protein product [Caretta caretta]
MSKKFTVCNEDTYAAYWESNGINSEVRWLAAMVIMEAMLAWRQMIWVGHVLCLDNNWLPKKVPYSEFDKGSRKVGLPNSARTKRHIQAAGLDLMTWEDTAHDRELGTPLQRKQNEQQNTIVLAWPTVGGNVETNLPWHVS